jgi:hypothetical protein
VTDSLFGESSPAFSPDGKFLYFLGAREWAPQLSANEFEYGTNRTTGIYALTLQKDGPNPFPVQNDEPNEKHDGGDVKKKEAAPEADRIDFDGLAARVTRVPIEADNILSMSVNDKAIVYSISDGFYYGRDGRFKPQIHVYKIKDRKDKTLVENVDNAALSDDGDKLLVQVGSSYKLYDVDGDGKDAKTIRSQRPDALRSAGCVISSRSGICRLPSGKSSVRPKASTMRARVSCSAPLIRSCGTLTGVGGTTVPSACRCRSTPKSSTGNPRRRSVKPSSVAERTSRNPMPLAILCRASAVAASTSPWLSLSRCSSATSHCSMEAVSVFAAPV